MRRSIFILSAILLFGFSAFSQSSDQKALQDFNTFLGPEKAAALDEGLASFYAFLEKNFPEEPDFSARTRAFVQQFNENYNPDSSWVYNFEARKNLIQVWEKSCLRKEIWIYGYETYSPKYNIRDLVVPETYSTDSLSDIGTLDLDLIYDSEEDLKIDTVAVAKMEAEWAEKRRNSLHTNFQGEFFYTLALYAQHNPFVKEYLEVILRENQISPGVMANALIENVQDLDNPFIQRVILVEFYFRFMIYPRWGK